MRRKSINLIAVMVFTLMLTAVLTYFDGSYATAADTEFDPSQYTIGMSMDLSGHFVHQTLRYAFNKRAQELGYNTLDLSVSSVNNTDVEAAFRAGLANGINGIAFWADEGRRSMMIEAKEAGVATVNMGFEIRQESGSMLDSSLPFKAYEYGATGAHALAQELVKRGVTSGTIGITQGGFNHTENNNAKGFSDTIASDYPQFRVLSVVEEGFDAAQSISRIIGIIQANQDTIVAGYSTTGSGGINWCSALDQLDMKGKLVVVGENYSEVTLGLVNSGELHGFMAEPLVEVAYAAVERLDKVLRGEPVEYYEYFETPFVGIDDVWKYEEIVAEVKAMFGGAYGTERWRDELLR